MSSFDTLFRGKKRSESSGRSEEILESNTSQRSYKDIRKRTKTLLIKPPKNIHQPRKITAEEKVFRIQDEIRKFGNSLKKRQIGVLVLVLFLSYIVYGVGFVLRTEKMITNIMTSPEKYYSVKKIRETIYMLWQDYQILGLITDNSPIPLEPLTSYGKILKNTRLLAGEAEKIVQTTHDILGWKNISDTKSIFPLLDTLWDIGESGEEDLRTLAESLFQITPPDQYIREYYERSIVYLSSFLSHRDIWYDLLGKTHPTRILVLNQNNDELRASGGFPGTVFLVEFEKGKIKNISFHDIYELDFKIKDYIAPPPGIDQSSSKTFPGKPLEFRIRDANYFPTFSESAKKINELMHIATRKDIDLVVAINTGLLSEIMNITGPINIDKIPVEITKDNASLILSMLVEAKEKIHGTHKGIITLLGDAVLDALIEKNKTVEITKVLWNHLEDGEILIASPQPRIQQAIDNIGLFDTWKKMDTDFVYPLFTSISRNKSDRIMTRDITIKRTTECTREVILTQKHGWSIAVESQIKKMAHDLNIVDKIPVLLPVQGGGENKQYLRFILPKGSTLSSSGRKVRLKTIETEDDETIIDGYVTTPIGGSSLVEFSYILPKNLCGTKTQFIKQAGLKNLTVTIEENEQILSEKSF